MKNEEFPIRILVKQNTEMASKLHWYRRQNQELASKNDELNTWVQNLSEVFAAVSGAWQSITVMEESLLALMKKKTDLRDKTVLGKYLGHFKAFSEIINNLEEKIKNPGHSDQSAFDAKNRLQSFVKNYEIFFKELVDAYFKFNDQYSQTLNELKTKTQLASITRNLISKELENQKKVKQFENFMGVFKETFKTYEAYNQHALLDGILKKKDEKIHQIEDKLYEQERRVKIFFDYNMGSIEKLLQKPQEDLSFQCYCGGSQLSYTKKIWQEGLEMMKSGSFQTKPNNQEKQNEESNVNQEKYELIQKEKNMLIDRNAILLEKIEKLRIQYKITDEMVLKSHVYAILKDQCQYLLDYCNQLLTKLKKNEEYLIDIEKQRNEEIKELKRKLEKIPNKQNELQKHHHSPTRTFEFFKTNLITEIKELKLSYRILTEKSINPEDIMITSKKQYQSLKRDNEEMNKKIDNLLEKSANQHMLDFRHQKFKEVERKIDQILGRQQMNQQFMELWRQFILYVKGRDKKIKDLEALIRKKQKEIQQKQKLEEIMKESLADTEKVFLLNNEKLSKTEDFIGKMEKQMVRLTEENFNTKTEYEQQNNFLNLRLKAESEARNKLQQKVSLINKIEQQLIEVRNMGQGVKDSYQEEVKGLKQQKQEHLKTIHEKQLQEKIEEQKHEEKQRHINKLLMEKQGLKSQIRQLKKRLQNLLQKSQDDILKIQLQEYRGKIMCSCTGDRQREIVLKSCPHLFCRKCIDDATNNRNRKCPICGIKFTKSDIHEIKWN